MTGVVSTWITAYTDGSRTENGSGAGYVIYYKNKPVAHASIKLNDEATVFQAEIIALKKAAEYIRMNMEPRYGKILSDSQAALFALLSLKNETSKSMTVLETVEELEHLALRANVRLAWVKAHVGIEGNEYADSAAKLGAEHPMGINKNFALGGPCHLLKTT